MKQYQYKVVSVSREKINEALEELGRGGWELCSAVMEGSGDNATMHLFLKKEI